MAGLAESCSHIGATLYAIEAGVRMRESSSCTMEKCQWLIPSHVQKIPAAQVEDIDFSSPKAKKIKMDSAIADIEMPTKHSTISTSSVAEVTVGSLEHHNFFNTLAQNFPESAALMAVKPFCDSLMPKAVSGCLPSPLSDLKVEASLKLNFDQLLDESQKIVITLSASEIKAVERETKNQSKSRLWFQHRAGRITASKLKAVLGTSTDLPSISLLKSICYPEAHKFTNKATRYGCDHEKKARKQYTEIMSKSHTNFSIADSGLQLSEKWPYLGASPDGLVSCSCCGDGVCEIKCPYCIKDSTAITELANRKHSCLTRRSGTLQLDRGHAYFYQVQCQMNVTGVLYCDFIVWTHDDIFVERILPDNELWESITIRAENFFRKCILPEILGRAFSDKKAAKRSGDSN